jgi:quercetin dioxygenase-like cupin family protein
MSSLPTIAQFFHQAAGQGKAYSAVGDKVVVLATGDQTGGAFCLAELTVPPGGGPPPHYHTREDECFYVLEGEVAFTCDGRTISGTPGSYVQLPRQVPHAFKNPGAKPARMLVLCAPAGFEKFMEKFATPLPSPDANPIPPTEAEIQKLLSVAPEFGIVMLPPVG